MMKNYTQKLGPVSATILFIGLPVLFYATGDFPRRSLLKESISMLSLLSFCLMLAQFFLARSNSNLLAGYNLGSVIKVHKIIGYLFAGVLLLHPLLLVAPRYFEAGVTPIDAFITILSTYNNFAVMSGLIAWVLLFVLLTTAYFRDTLPLEYKTWRLSHGLLSIVFIVFSSWHAINLGRHTTLIMSTYISILAISGILLLLKVHLLQPVVKVGKSQ